MSDYRAAERVLYAAYIAWYGEDRPVYAPVFSWPGVIRTKACMKARSPVTEEEQAQNFNFVSKEETPTWLRKK